MITDLGGFAATTYKRGIAISTSPPHQVDASVGGKTGINFEGYKNEIVHSTHLNMLLSL